MNEQHAAEGVAFKAAASPLDAIGLKVAFNLALEARPAWGRAQILLDSSFRFGGGREGHEPLAPWREAACIAAPVGLPCRRLTASGISVSDKTIIAGNV
jgi:hypothetical protein